MSIPPIPRIPRLRANTPGRACVAHPGVGILICPVHLNRIALYASRALTVAA
jgi:hypothetical protein